MWRKIILALIILILAGGVGFFVFKSEPRLNKNFEHTASFFKNHPFRLGLDLSGGSHLVYQADLADIDKSQVSGVMETLRNSIEKRVNAFGVSEALVQVQESGFISGGEERIIVDLPGVTDVEKAVTMIGNTPFLQFKVENPNPKPQEFKVGKDGKVVGNINLDNNKVEYIDTELTGRYLDRASLDFDSNSRPVIKLNFTPTGAELFANITKANVNKTIAIYMDGEQISAPVVESAILTGEAVITSRSRDKLSVQAVNARDLVARLNSGTLSAPIELISKQTIGATLGDSAMRAGVKATIIGFLLVALFLVLWYRLPGLVATISLLIFISIMLALFKLIPVTLTAAGIAGFIISIGVAVDANVLIFERIKEELHSGKKVVDATSIGFDRAWLSIRDSNISNVITALILYWFGTSLIKGFAFTLGMGVAISMFSAIVVTRIFLKSISFMGNGKVARFLFSSGLLE